jgi:predicted Zn-dependent protease
MSETKSRELLRACFCFLPAAFCILLSAFCLLASELARAQDDVVLRAMRDELTRSMQQLQLEKLEKPYFVAYRVTEKNAAHVKASFGALLVGSSVRHRFLVVEVRVGSPKFDNSHFLSMSFLNRGGLAGGFGGTSLLPLEDNYKELRRQLWLATDSAYKKALEDLSRKRAALENKTSTEAIPDFSEQQPATITEAQTPAKIEVAQLESLARSLSAVFKGSPTIFSDSAEVTMDQTYTRYVNSEGTTFTRNTPVASLVLLAETQAADGAPLRDFLAAYGHSINDLPSPHELESRALAMGQRLEKLRSAPLVDHYNGPVLFEGQAAAELFSQVLAPALLAMRSPVSDVPQFELFSGSLENPYQDRLGGRVLPDFLSVADDPSLSRYQDEPLLGARRVDDDGVPTRRTVLVENGTLKTLLATRDPIAGVTQSTGSRRGGTVAPSNLLVTATQGLPDEAMKAKLLSLMQQRGKPFGIVVERLANPMAGEAQGMMVSLMSIIMPGRGGEAATRLALVAYKIFPDGHQELVRNLAIEGVTTASFKEVVAASANSLVYSTPFVSMRHSVFSIFGGGSAAEIGAPVVSFVVPSLLFDDISLKRPMKEIPKLPLSPRPVGD